MLPANYTSYITELLGNDIASTLDFLQTPSTKQYVRLNPYKTNLQLPFKKVFGVVNGYELPESYLFTADPAWHAGFYYAQEASSMVIGEIVKDLLPATEATVLDLCAAPGGKSTHISAILKPGDLLIANEIIKSRTPILLENLTKWGNPNFMVTALDAKVLGNYTSTVDIIVADVPCSGEGMFRKNPNAALHWSLDNVSHCALRQKRIVHDVWPMLKENGYLVYSTCTINPEENEFNIKQLCADLDATIVEIKHAADLNLSQWNEFGYRKLLNASQGEPFFVAILQKKEKEKPLKFTKPQAWKDSIHFEDCKEIGTDTVCISNVSQELRHVFSHLSVLAYSGGLPIGKMIKDNCVFSAGFALCKEKPIVNVTIITLNETEIIQFLKSESMRLNEKSMYLTVKYNNLPIGLLKNAGNRYNNLWPKEWRILSNKIDRALPGFIALK